MRDWSCDTAKSVSATTTVGPKGVGMGKALQIPQSSRARQGPCDRQPNGG